MLENINDYLSVLSILLVLVLTFSFALYLFNLKIVKKNVRKEIEYYGYEKNDLTQKSGK